MIKKEDDKIDVEIHEYSLKNYLGEWLEVECHFGESYVTLKIESQESFTIGSIDELDEICNKIKATWP